MLLSYIVDFFLICIITLCYLTLYADPQLKIAIFWSSKTIVLIGALRVKQEWSLPETCFSQMTHSKKEVGMPWHPRKRKNYMNWTHVAAMTLRFLSSYSMLPLVVFHYARWKQLVYCYGKWCHFYTRMPFSRRCAICITHRSQKITVDRKFVLIWPWHGVTFLTSDDIDLLSKFQWNIRIR